MKKLQTIQAMRDHLTPIRQAGQRIGFVPTMGAIHEGHRSLIRAARTACREVVVSIFVNPTQFGPGEDFDRYPRPLEADLNACREEGVSAVFCPSIAEMYPSLGAVPIPARRDSRGNIMATRIPMSIGIAMPPEDSATTKVSVARLSEQLCGPFRPGHFDGVTTVVAKLFNAVQPDVAYFGQKDYQQSVIIRRMVRDLLWPIEIVVCPTVREPDGLAMSSRNAYLTPEQRKQAASLYATLQWARDQIQSPKRKRGPRQEEIDVPDLLQTMRIKIKSAGPCVIEYVQLADPEDLTPRTTIAGPSLLALAVRIGQCRLIDNLLVDADTAIR